MSVAPDIYLEFLDDTVPEGTSVASVDIVEIEFESNVQGIALPIAEYIEFYEGGYGGMPGLSAYDLAVQEGYTGTLTEWLASLEGDSAYEVAVENGFTGTMAEWLVSLQGKSAYQLAVEEGYEGTIEEWLASGGTGIIDGGDPSSSNTGVIDGGSV